MLSLCDISELLTVQCIKVSHEIVKAWNLTFGQTYASEIKRRAPRRGDEWRMVEMCLVMKGKKHWLWRAVDKDSYELDILLQSRKNKGAAKRFFKKLLKGLQYVPRVIITDKLRSYGASKREISPDVEHRQHKRLNNKVENSHQPTR